LAGANVTIGSELDAISSVKDIEIAIELSQRIKVVFVQDCILHPLAYIGAHGNYYQTPEPQGETFISYAAEKGYYHVKTKEEYLEKSMALKDLSLWKLPWDTWLLLVQLPGDYPWGSEQLSRYNRLTNDLGKLLQESDALLYQAKQKDAMADHLCRMWNVTSNASQQDVASIFNPIVTAAAAAAAATPILLRAEPAQPAQPEQPAQPAQHAQPAQGAQPAQSARPAQRAQPSPVLRPLHRTRSQQRLAERLDSPPAPARLNYEILETLD
jgi:hypothetical protein